MGCAVKDDQRGVALIMTVAVIAIVITLTSTAVGVVVTNVVDSRRANARTAARAAAEAAADDVFARVVRDPGYLQHAYLNHPGYRPNWATFSNGAPGRCRDPYRQVCFQIAVTAAAQPGNPYASAATVEVVAATLCPRGTDHLSECITDGVRQRLSQRQYFDYLYLDQLETLDPVLYPSAAARDQAARACPVVAASRPSSCVPVPFLGGLGSGSGDEVDGPIHTNDASFSTCLSPTFRPGVDRAGWPSAKTVSDDPTTLESTGGSVFSRAAGSACAGSAPRETPPGRVVEVANAPTYSFAVDVTDLAGIASPVDTYQGTSTITLNGGTTPGVGGYAAEAGPQQASSHSASRWPGRGVIFVAGDAYVSGVACDPVSIVATGDIFVDGDLTYGPAVSCPMAAIGLEADNSVVVLPTAGPSGPLVNASSDRTIEAAVLALGKNSCFSASAGGSPPPPGVTCAVTGGGVVRGGSFYVQGWDTAVVPSGATPHALHFLGAIATVWRGAIGAFDPTSGRLVSGWAKDFAFDRQLRTTQPPYFLAPVGAGWARSDLDEVGTP